MIAPAGQLEIGAARLEYRRWSPEPGAARNGAPTLILLHEGLGCLALWRDFPERLAAATGLGVLAYSRAGYGGSTPCALPRPLTYMHDEAREVLPAVLDAVGLARGVLLGHSDGASIAAIYAGSRPDPRISGLVLIAPHFFTEPEGLAAIAAAKLAYETGDLRDRLAKYHRNVEAAFRGWNEAWLDPGFETWDLTEFLPGIEVPLLLIQGADDSYGSARQVETARDLAPGPSEIHLLPACRHSPHLERPEETLAAIRSFLETGQAGKPVL
ncbi:MAG: alpha/beta hydrolase [Kiloniellales bacterium]|nr:alpha/beta hydrolase [Kiloniellales bacterium]